MEYQSLTPPFKSGFVINLARRPDRLAQFFNDLPSLGFPVERWNAVDGTDLELDSGLLRKVRPNLALIPENKLKRVLGCSLSHLYLWKHITSLDDGWYVIFEDDARVLGPSVASQFKGLTARFPHYAEIIWLNEFCRYTFSSMLNRVLRRLDSAFGSYRYRRLLIQLLRDIRLLLCGPHMSPYSTQQPITSEAYALTPFGAQRLYELCKDNLDAADVNIFLHASLSGVRACVCVPPLFGQNRNLQSDIELPS